MLRRELATRGLDHLVFSGDATMLGFDTEMAAAAAALGVGDRALPPCIAVPGNHDVYVARTERRGAFEAAFAAWQQGERVGKAIYPFARKVGHVWLIAVNSAKSNFWLWDATGRSARSNSPASASCAPASTPARGSSSATTRS